MILINAILLFNNNLIINKRNVRRKDSSISAVEENKKMHFIQTKNVKSCSDKIANDIFITIEQI